MPVLIPLYMFISYYRKYLETKVASAAAAAAPWEKKLERVVSQWGEIPFCIFILSCRDTTGHNAFRHITLLH